MDAHAKLDQYKRTDAHLVAHVRATTGRYVDVEKTLSIQSRD